MRTLLTMPDCGVLRGVLDLTARLASFDDRPVEAVPARRVDVVDG